MTPRCLIVSVLLSCTACSTAQAQDARQCELFEHLLDAPRATGIGRYVILAPDVGPYQNLDVDGDGIIDKVDGGCSPSSQMPDPCLLSIELSTGKKQLFEFPEGERFFLFRYRGHFYATSSPDGDASPVKGKRMVYSLGFDGITLICFGL